MDVLLLTLIGAMLLSVIWVIGDGIQYAKNSKMPLGWGTKLKIWLNGILAILIAIVFVLVAFGIAS